MPPCTYSVDLAHVIPLLEFHYFEFFCCVFRNVITNQNNSRFISPKRKITILKMALKSFNISKLEHQMSKSWKWIAGHLFKTINKSDCPAQDFNKSFLYSKHALKVCFKPSRKNQDFRFLQPPSKPVWLKNAWFLKIS